jgi:hypothetical protein
MMVFVGRYCLVDAYPVEKYLLHHDDGDGGACVQEEEIDLSFFVLNLMKMSY